MTFPIGTICDKCNQYLGNQLETMLVEHPLISAQIQSYGLPGKKGPRKKLGVFERLRGEEALIRFPINAPVPIYEHGIRVGFRVTPKWNQAFDMDRFSRGLHMVAFNLSALNRGIESAFHRRYDRVREYIRKPKRSERWPFLQIIRPHHDVRLVPKVNPMDFDDAEIVRIEYLNATWFVDLLGTGLLRREGVRVTASSGVSWELIDSDWSAPEDRPIIVDGMQVHYRAEIY
jgi:hypothetical protein